MSGFPHTSNLYNQNRTRVSLWAKTTEDHGASTSDPHTVQNRVLGHASPTSADLFEIVAFSHSEFKRPSSQTSERLLLCKRVTVSFTLFLSQEWLAMSYSTSGFHLDNNMKYVFIFLMSVNIHIMALSISVCATNI